MSIKTEIRSYINSIKSLRFDDLVMLGKQVMVNILSEFCNIETGECYNPTLMSEITAAVLTMSVCIMKMDNCLSAKEVYFLESTTPYDSETLKGFINESSDICRSRNPKNISDNMLILVDILKTKERMMLASKYICLVGCADGRLQMAEKVYIKCIADVFDAASMN